MRKILINGLFSVIFLLALVFSSSEVWAGCSEGSSTCGSDYCSNGVPYDICCTPNCQSASKICWDSVSCEPANCVTTTFCTTHPRADWGPTPNGYCCPTVVHCGPGGTVSTCGWVECNNTTGNCYSDCTTCSSPSPSPSGSPTPTPRPATPTPTPAAPTPTPTVPGPSVPPAPTPIPSAGCIVEEGFNSSPFWSSSDDAPWGQAANWSAPGYLFATRSQKGSSAKVKVYSIAPYTDYTIAIDMMGTSGTDYWTEAAYKFGNNTASNFNNYSGTWNYLNKFGSYVGYANGNGGVWSTYPDTINSGINTEISIGYKAGNNPSGNYPGGIWDNLRICSIAATPTPTPAAVTCTVTVGDQTIQVGDTVNLIPNITIIPQLSDTVNSVWFSSSSASIVSLNPSNNSIDPYGTIGTGVAVGSSRITTAVLLNNSWATCMTNSTLVTVSANAVKWFKTGGGDIHGNEFVGTNIPTSDWFSGDPPGVVSTGMGFNGNVDGKMSSPLWQVNSPTENLSSFGSVQKYDYDYFYNKLNGIGATVLTFGLPSSEHGVTNGGIYRVTGSPVETVHNWAIDSGDKITVFVNGSLLIKNQIQVEAGSFLAFIVSGDIIFDRTLGNNPYSSSEKSVEGVYIANGFIRSTIVGETSNKQLIATGIFVADANLDRAGCLPYPPNPPCSTFDLTGRDLGRDNETYAAEEFTYRPDFVVNCPWDLHTKKVGWQESTP